MLRILLLISMAFFVAGCGNEEENWGAKPFVEMEQETIYLSEHAELCERKPKSIFCKNSPSIGDIQPDRAYALEVLKEMNSNFKYKADDTWHYNNTVYEYLKGDCEDIASTMAKHMVEEGIDKEYLYLVYRKISDTEAHLFLAVDTRDAGLLHLDYGNSGYPIEPRINFHLPMVNVGVHKWVKGNIR